MTEHVEWYEPADAQATYNVLRRARKFCSQWGGDYALTCPCVEGDNIVAANRRAIYWGKTQTGVPEETQVIVPPVKLTTRASDVHLLRFGLDAERQVSHLQIGNQVYTNDDLADFRYPPWRSAIRNLKSKVVEGISVSLSYVKWKKIIRGIANLREETPIIRVSVEDGGAYVLSDDGAQKVQVATVQPATERVTGMLNAKEWLKCVSLPRVREVAFHVWDGYVNVAFYCADGASCYLMGIKA